jgi:hypothetical protein
MSLARDATANPPTADTNSMGEASMNSDYSTPTAAPDALETGSIIPVSRQWNESEVPSLAVATSPDPSTLDPRGSFSYAGSPSRSQSPVPEMALPPSEGAAQASAPSSSWDVSETIDRSLMTDDQSMGSPSFTPTSRDPTEMLAVALMVEDEDTMTETLPPATTPSDSGLAIQIAQAEPVSAYEGDGDRVKLRRRVPYYLLGFIVVVSLLTMIGLILGLTLSKSSDSPASQTPSGTGDDTAPREFSMESFIEFDIPVYSRRAISADKESPQARAITFLSQDPQLANYTKRRRLTRFALAVLYFSLNGEMEGTNRNATAGWVTNASECEWDTEDYEVAVCDSSGAFSTLYLEERQLTGTLPAEIELLSDVQGIYLTTNNVSGSIPSEIGNLDLLSFLYLEDNNLTGTLPSTLGNVRGLQQLYMAYNDVSGTIPATLFGSEKKDRQLVGLSNDTSEEGFLRGSNGRSLQQDENEKFHLLEYLDLDSNMLTGTIPSTFTMARNLRTFYFLNNMLEGTIPENMFQLSYLCGGGKSPARFRVRRRQLFSCRRCCCILHSCDFCCLLL